MPDIPPIRFSKDFYDGDWPRLPEPVRDALSEFLIRLQHSPRDTEIYDAAQKKRQRYAYCFFDGWLVYWYLDVDEEAASILRHGVRHIYVLAVEAQA